MQHKDDRIVIDCAIAAKAEYIVMRDLDFVSYGKLAGLSIVTPVKILRLEQN